MRWLLDKAFDSERVAQIISAAGGKVVGRTRLQKMVYLLQVAGLEDDFSFEYKHYGPYSEQLTRAISLANLKGQIREVEAPATWGGTYSVFTAETEQRNVASDGETALLQIANEANPIELELAATALFLHAEGWDDPWLETVNRKPEKAQKLEGAKRLLHRLHRVDAPTQIPVL